MKDRRWAATYLVGGSMVADLIVASLAVGIVQSTPVPFGPLVVVAALVVLQTSITVMSYRLSWHPVPWAMCTLAEVIIGIAIYVGVVGIALI